MLSYGRAELVERISGIPRYIVCGRVTKRPVFAFISRLIRPNDALQVFLFEDDYSFGVLQSGMHWEWFTARCSTLKGDFRYTSNTVFDSFPWPQSPTQRQISETAAAAVFLRDVRSRVMHENNWSLRDLYRTLELPGRSALKDAHAALDAAVRAAYGMRGKSSALEFLLKLNMELSAQEAADKSITGPGLRSLTKDNHRFITSDCVEPR